MDELFSSALKYALPSVTRTVFNTRNENFATFMDPLSDVIAWVTKLAKNVFRSFETSFSPSMHCRVASLTAVSLFSFWALQLSLEKVILPNLWTKGWSKLDDAMRRAFVMRIVSVTVRF